MANSAARCLSCNGKIDAITLRPYCSVVCSILGMRGLGWRTDPCGIIDPETGSLLDGGPLFDLSPKCLAKLQAVAVTFRSHRQGIAASPMIQQQGIGTQQVTAHRSILEAQPA